MTGSRAASRPVFRATDGDERVVLLLNLGEEEEAMDWLREAVRRGGIRKIRAMALGDDDLEPLWAKIRKLK